MQKLLITILCLVSVSNCLAQDSNTNGKNPRVNNATTLVLQVDMARKQDAAKVDMFFNPLETCQAKVLQIHYSFAEVKLSQNAKTCLVRVEVMGELTEDEKPLIWQCNKTGLRQMKWLQDDVPMTELQNAETCQFMQTK